jgi:hypothetical protein
LFVALQVSVLLIDRLAEVALIGRGRLNLYPFVIIQID